MMLPKRNNGAPSGSDDTVWARTRKRDQGRCAFSLVEVVLAMGIAVFVIVPLFALLPEGMNVNRDSQSESAAINAMMSVVGDRRSSPLTSTSVVYGLASLSPAMATTTNAPIYLDESYAVTTQADATYRVDAIFTPPPASSLSPYLMYCQVSWPAQSATRQKWVDTVAAIPQ